MPSTPDPGRELISRRSVVTHGMTKDAFYTKVHAEGLKSVRPGWFTPHDHEFPEQRHREQIVAAVAELRGAAQSAVVSHVSAAAWHGLPVWGIDTSRVQITRPGVAGLASTKSIQPHRAQLTDGEITVVDGVRVTTLARTVLDIARCHPFTQGVVVADAAFHRGLTDEEATGVWDLARSRRSARLSHRVIEFADGRAESALESRSRVYIAAVGLPVPELQVKIRDARGAEVGRVDFDFGELRTVGESDGEIKFTSLLRPGETAAEVRARQDARENRIANTGLQVVRWGSRDLDDPLTILRRFMAAFRRAGFPRWTPGPSRLPFLQWEALRGWTDVPD